MTRTVRSARGVQIDFDLLRIKESLGATPKVATVRVREDFIDQKLKRKLKRLVTAVPVAPAPTEGTDVPPQHPVTKEGN